MNRKVKKAVFPVAGFGTRFLPATKAMPKELLPIVDKPLIQYAVEEAIVAGIDTLIFVTGRNKRAIEDHFDVNKELELALRSKGKNEQADMVRNIVPPHVECIFVRQPEQLGLGHAVLCAERATAGDPFAVLLADDFLTDYAPGVTADLVGAFEKTGNSQISVMQVDEAYISQYGVIIPSSDGHGVMGVVEKPKQDEAPSNLASIGRYVLTPDIFDSLRTLPVGSGGEIQLADALNLHARDGLLEAIHLKGIRFDCGSVGGFMSASAHEYAKRLEN
ncbi:UTP--glucose-1-phosphate uridylyltransferase GalU [Amylibacter sp.]|nr:UTP--glucose-1-phosphate uridylyltransferase GalU [Amylibacter sp.]